MGDLNEIKIGKFYFTKFDSSEIWIYKMPSGEGFKLKGKFCASKKCQKELTDFLETWFKKWM